MTRCTSTGQRARFIALCFLVAPACSDDGGTDTGDTIVSLDADARAVDTVGGAADAGADTVLSDTGGTPDADADAPSDTLLDGGPPDVAPRDTTRPPVAFQDTYSLMAGHPEGGDYDPVGEHFYVGSLSEGSVHRVDPRTGLDEAIFTETAPGTWWTLGMHVDAERRRLWVCAMDDRSATTTDVPPYDGYVWVFDLNTRARVATYALGNSDTPGTCTDVTVTANGTAYVVDREGPYIWKITQANGVTLFATDPALGSDVVGQNAVIELPGQNALLVAVYLPPALVRVNLQTAEVQKLLLSGEPFFSIALLSGADGMTYRDNAVYVVFSGKLFWISPTWPDWTSAKVAGDEAPVGLTDVINTPGGLYLLNGQALEFAAGSPTAPFALVRYQGEL